MSKKVKEFITIATTNEFKKEYFKKYFEELLKNNKNNEKEYVIKFKKPLDEEEVDGTPEEVIIYKAKQNPGTKKRPIYVEDTTVTIIGENGKEIPMVDIKWKINELKNYKGYKIKITTYIGKNDGEKITVYKGGFIGIIGEPVNYGYGFDPYVIVNEKGQRLADFINIKDRLPMIQEQKHLKR